MGLFDDLKKLTKNIGKEIENSGVKDDFSKFGKEVISGVKDLERRTSEFLKSTDNGDKPVSDSSDSMGDAFDNSEDRVGYEDFPAFNKRADRTENRDTDKYKRRSFIYKNVTQDEIDNYLDQITSAGFVKMTDVRYERGNTYIIVDANYSTGLNIVFHIKK